MYIYYSGTKNLSDMLSFISKQNKSTSEQQIVFKLFRLYGTNAVFLNPFWTRPRHTEGPAHHLRRNQT